MITIQSALRSLNVTGTLAGFRYTAAALSLILKDEDWLSNLNKKLYPYLAGQFGCSIVSVSSAISYLISKVWELDQEKKLEEMAGFPLYKAPSNQQFLTILYNYIIRS